MRVMHVAKTSIIAVVSVVLLASIAHGGSDSEYGPARALDVQSDIPFSPADVFYIQQLGDTQTEPGDVTYSNLFSHVDAERKRYAVVRMEFKDAKSCQQAVSKLKHVISSYDRFADAFIEAQPKALNRLKALDGLVWSEVDRWGLVPPPTHPEFADEKSKTPPLKIVRGGLQQLTGKGVTIAVIDTGIDFRHPDFIQYDETGKPTSRVLYFWDTLSDTHAHGTGVAAPVKFPNGAPIGTLYSRDDLNKELRGFRPMVPERDLNGHGTACAGIAAGNGNVNDKYRGVAAQADIIAVRVGKSSNLTNTFLINAICQWLDDVAGQQPLVISCSWGGQYGGRDGQGILERQLNARFSLSRQSRAICFAAGNEGARALHSPVTVGSKQKRGETRFRCTGFCELSFYVQSDNPDDIYVGHVGDNTEIKSVKAHVNPLTNQVVVKVMVANNGVGGAYIYSDSQRGVQSDVYIAGPNASFHPRFATPEKQLSSPATAASVLTIGSFDWNDQFNRAGTMVNLTDPNTKKPLKIGFASSYSNPGPLRIGKNVKPEIAGPGQWYTAPAPLNVELTRDSTGFYRPFNGTSAATPYVAGIIALLFEENPQMTFGEVRKRLIKNASKAQSAQKQIGYGKLDHAAIQRLFGLDE